MLQLIDAVCHLNVGCPGFDRTPLEAARREMEACLYVRVGKWVVGLATLDNTGLQYVRESYLEKALRELGDLEICILTGAHTS
jgi:hypothetical protein